MESQIFRDISTELDLNGPYLTFSTQPSDQSANTGDPILYTERVLIETKNTDLLFLLNRQGLENFSPKQATRLRKVLAEVESTIEQADLNFERNKRLQRLKTLGIKNVPASALESDEALDKFIKQQGGLEPQYTEGEL